MKYKKNLIGKKSLVLFENKINGKDEFFGRDEFANSVIVKNNENLIGKIKEVNIFSGNQKTLFGIIRKTQNQKESRAGSVSSRNSEFK